MWPAVSTSTPAKAPKSAKYLRGRGPLTLVYTKAVGTRSDALREELRIKRLTKAQKERLVASTSVETIH